MTNHIKYECQETKGNCKTCKAEIKRSDLLTHECPETKMKRLEAEIAKLKEDVNLKELYY